METPREMHGHDCLENVRLLMSRGDAQAALEMVERMLEAADTTIPDLHYLRAQAHLALDQRAQALRF